MARAFVESEPEPEIQPEIRAPTRPVAHPEFSRVEEREILSLSGSSQDSSLHSTEPLRATRYWGRWSKRFPSVVEKIQQLEDVNHPIISVSSRDHTERIFGFPDLARHMGDRNCQTIFRSFSTLRCRMLLYLQQEILELERELDLIERAQEDAGIHHDIGWFRGGNQEGSLADAQHQIVETLFPRLSQHAELLLQQHRLYKLPEPSMAEVQDVLDFVTDPKNNPASHFQRSFTPGEPDSCMPWMKRHNLAAWYVGEDNNNDNGRGKKQVLEKDLVSLSGSYKVDRFTRLLTEKIVGSVARSVRRVQRWIVPSSISSRYGPIVGDMVTGKSIDHLSDTISLVFASTLPSVSVIVLYYIESPIWKLIFLMLWTILFSVALHTLTTATREQVFSASVAIAAVQVVFIGSSIVQTVKVDEQ